MAFLHQYHRFVLGSAACVRKSGASTVGTYRGPLASCVALSTTLSFIQAGGFLSGRVHHRGCSGVLWTMGRSRASKPASSPLQKSKNRARGKSPPEPPTGDDLHRMRRKASMIQKALCSVYPVAPKGFLEHHNTYTLLIAVLLSAQTTDKKVNEVTPQLFAAADTPEAMADLGVESVREHIKTVGLAPGKSKNIVALSKMLVNEHDGEVPDTFEELEALPGVGHKTASVVMMQAFSKPAFPVDTHIHRLACRWGCGDQKSVEKTEALLKMWFPDESTWGELHTRIILFGREYCPAIRHDVDVCPICAFAATPEVEELAVGSPRKFVAPPSYKDPYSLRSGWEESSKAERVLARASMSRKMMSSPKKKPRKVSTRDVRPAGRDVDVAVSTPRGRRRVVQGVSNTQDKPSGLRTEYRENFDLKVPMPVKTEDKVGGKRRGKRMREASPLPKEEETGLSEVSSRHTKKPLASHQLVKTAKMRGGEVHASRRPGLRSSRRSTASDS